MKKKAAKLSVLIDPKELCRRIKSRKDSYLIRHSYLLKKRIAPFPKAVVFVINENCNGRCKMCDIGTKNNQTHIYKLMAPGGGGYLSLHDFKQVIDSVLSEKPDIWFMGTEPLLYLHFLEAAAYVKEKGLKFLFTTNGILLPDYARDIVRLGIDRVLLSCMGGNSEVHDSILGVRGGFDKLANGLSLINEAKKHSGAKNPEVSVNLVITNDNYGRLYEHVKFFINSDIDKLTISNTQFVTKKMACAHKSILPEDNVTESSVFSFDPSHVDTKLLFSQVRRIFKDFGHFNIAIVPNIKSLAQFEKYYKKPEEFLSGYKACYYPWRFAHILPNGDVVVSWRCFGKAAGNIKKEPFKKIWNNADFQNIRIKMIKNKGSYPLCARCGFLWCSYNM